MTLIILEVQIVVLRKFICNTIYHILSKYRYCLSMWAKFPINSSKLCTNKTANKSAKYIRFIYQRYQWLGVVVLPIFNWPQKKGRSFEITCIYLNVSKSINSLLMNGFWLFFLRRNKGSSKVFSISQWYLTVYFKDTPRSSSKTNRCGISIEVLLG